MDVQLFPTWGVRESAEATPREQSCFVPQDLNTPPGAVTLRGGWNFQTQTGWNTGYTPIFNAIERPVAPMFVVRVETDWYAHESEFRRQHFERIPERG